LELEKADEQKEASAGIVMVPKLQLETEKTRADWPAGTSEDSSRRESATQKIEDLAENPVLTIALKI
jgi:hypothetical protein